MSDFAASRWLSYRRPSAVDHMKRKIRRDKTAGDAAPISATCQAAKHQKLLPPAGYSSWLAYAVATMDDRGLDNDQDAGCQPQWPTRVSRAEMRSAAQAELAQVEAIWREMKRAGCGEHADEKPSPDLAHPGGSRRRVAAIEQIQGEGIPLKEPSAEARRPGNTRRKRIRVLLPEFEKLMAQPPGNDVEAALEKDRGDR